MGEVAGGARAASDRLVRREPAAGIEGGKEGSGRFVAAPLPAEVEPPARESHAPDPSPGGEVVPEPAACIVEVGAASGRLGLGLGRLGSVGM